MEDDMKYLNRLKEGQHQFLEDNLKRQESRKKLLEDYGKLIQRLKTLPNTTTQKTMVPIGNVAFLPGKIVHTNEIMVLLGDNWFAERSAVQASEIAERRLKMVQTQLDELIKEHDHIKSNLSYTDKFFQTKLDEETKEIKEKLPKNFQSAKGKCRIAHKAKHNFFPRAVTFKNTEEAVQSFSKDLNAEREIGSDGSLCTINHNELMSRLNQLEREEQATEQLKHDKVMESIINGTYQPANKNNTNEDQQLSNVDRPRQVKFRNQHLGPSGSDDNTESCETDEMVSIHFEHTDASNFNNLKRSLSDSNLHTADTTEDPSIKTPADIYERFYTSSHLSDSEEDATKPLKSILKKDSRSSSSENLKLRPILKTSPEHRPGTPEHVLDERHSILKTPPDTQASDDRRPGTPDNVLDDPTTAHTTVNLPSILKPTHQTSSNTDREEYSITNSVEEDDQSGQGDIIRPILKAHQQEMQGSTTAFQPQDFSSATANSSFTPVVSFSNSIDGSTTSSVSRSRSILKHHSTFDSQQQQQSDRTRAFSPETAAVVGSSSKINETARSVRIKSPDRTHGVDLSGCDGATAMDRRPILKSPNDWHNKPAFTGTIVVRDFVESEATIKEPTINNTTSTTRNTKPVNSNKPISKFKASRMNKK